MFLEIGGKIVELIEGIVDGVKSAVRAVEAVFRTVVASVAKVVDWLKALFAFRDIWETKKALEAGIKLVLDYGGATLKHFQKEAAGWFGRQEAEIPILFDRLRARFGDTRAGDLRNRTPAVTDASGSVVDPKGLQRDPRTTWMLSQVGSHAIAVPTLLAAEFVGDSPLTSPYTALLNAVEASGLADLFSPIADAVMGLANPADPNAANTVQISALLDKLQDGAIRLLQAADGLTATVFELLEQMLTTLLDELTKTRDLGFISTLYRRVQHNMNPDTVPEELSLLGLFTLVVAFFVTAVHKLAFGVHSAPFPGGLFPVIPAPPWHPNHVVGEGTSGDPYAMAALQATAWSAGLASAVFNLFLDATVLNPQLDNAFLPMITCGYVVSNLISVVMGTCPSVVGVDWAEDGGLWSAIFVIATAWTSIQGIAAVVYLFPKARENKLISSPVLKNTGNGFLGPVIALLAGGTLVGLTSAAVARAKVRPFLAAPAVIQFLPEVLPIIRINVQPFLPDSTHCVPDVRVRDVLATDDLAGIALLGDCLALPNRRPSRRGGTGRRSI